MENLYFEQIGGNPQFVLEYTPINSELEDNKVEIDDPTNPKDPGSPTIPKIPNTDNPILNP